MKKNIIFGFFGIALLFLATSCKDTLDTHPMDSFDEETVWSSFATASAFVNSTYESVLNGTFAGSGSAVTWESRTPNSVEADQVTRPSDALARESGITRSNDYGANQASRLRKCNTIIEKAGSNENLSSEEKKQLVAEGKFLRAVVFFDQARKMGRFLPIRQVFTQDDGELASGIKMTSSVKESYDIIIEDFSAAIDGLPETSQTGRANKYAAEVMLSSACLQAYAYTGESAYLDRCINAAKDVVSNKSLSSNYAGMFNDEDPTNPEILLGYYRLAQNTKMYYYNETQLTQPNIVTSQQENNGGTPWANKDGQTFCAWGVYWPTQDLVDQYLAIDEKTGEALPWWETSQWTENVDELDPSTVTEPGQIDYHNQVNGQPRRMPSPMTFDLANPKTPTITRYSVLKKDRTDTRDISDIMYTNRDARFDASIVSDKDVFVNETFEMNLNGNAGLGCRDKEDGAWYNTSTNYYWRKNTLEHPVNTYYADVNIDYHFVIARVGEAYMNLAEAYLLKGQVADAVEALNATRVTHGKIPGSKAATLEEAIVDYMRERNVEMTNEHGDMYFTYLRWGKYGGDWNHGRAAGDVIYDLDRATYKMEINRDRTAICVSQATITSCSQRQFTTRRYLLPIAQSFLDTREAYKLDHEQNPGW